MFVLGTEREQNGDKHYEIDMSNVPQREPNANVPNANHIPPSRVRWFKFWWNIGFIICDNCDVICDLLCNLGLLDKDDDLRASHELLNTERTLQISKIGAEILLLEF